MTVARIIQPAITDPEEILGHYPLVRCPDQYRDKTGSPFLGMPEYLPTPHEIGPRIEWPTPPQKRRIYGQGWRQGTASLFRNARLQLRPWQVDLLECNKRLMVLVAGRRGGKSMSAGIRVGRDAYEEVGTFYFACPTAKQCKANILDSFTTDGRKILDVIINPNTISHVNRTDGIITLTNKSKILLAGCEHRDGSLSVGANFQGAVFSEFSKVNNGLEIFNNQIAPTLLLTKGWAIFESTVDGENDFYRILQIAKGDPDNSHYIIVTARDYLPEDEQWHQIYTYRHDHPAILRQYYCDFQAISTTETVWGDLLDRTPPEKDLVDTSRPIFTAWDLGENCWTAIFFFQIHGKEVRVVNYYENRLQSSIAFYGRIVRDYCAHFPDSVHYLPHDAAHVLGVREPRQQVLDSMGLTTVIIPKCHLKSAEVEQCRSWLSTSKVRWDVNAEHGMRRVKQFRWRYHEGIRLNDFVKDGNNDAADAFRCMYRALQTMPGYHPMRWTEWEDKDYTY